MEENKIKELFSDEAFVNALMELDIAAGAIAGAATLGKTTHSLTRGRW